MTWTNRPSDPVLTKKLLQQRHSSHSLLAEFLRWLESPHLANISLLAPHANDKVLMVVLPIIPVLDP
jgi:hypothetical protein